MDDGYLALRWNNHNLIFTKLLSFLRDQDAYTDVSLACGGRLYPAHKFVLSTCSEYFKEMFVKTPCVHPVIFLKDVTERDLESLLDFMYKGEVHVPQNELGSLLRTAESLQIKGLAVPDDAPRSPSPTESIPVVLPPKPVTSRKTNLQVKRRLSGSEKQEDCSQPKNQPDVQTQNSIKNWKPKKDSSSAPVRKKIKLEGSIRNSKHYAESNVSTPLNDISDLNSESPGSSHLQCDDVSSVFTKQEIKEEDLPGDPEAYIEESDSDLNKGPPTEFEDEPEENAIDEKIYQEHSEGEENYDQSNPSLPNSELSTVELLQVDLNEDGTQFIIAPGEFGGCISRTSSVAGEEEVAEVQKKPFICFLCGHSFTRRDNLANHLKTHTGDRPFTCKYCQKCFSRKDYLKQHERIHTGEKPYACEICGRAFTRKEGLTDHMRCHSDLKAFACELCGKSFKQKCGLRFHRRNYKH